MTDHPRSRGVYYALTWMRSKAAGSSPLARGLRRGHRHHGEPERIIPARAGFTTGMGTLQDKIRDHPRSRGVYVRPYDRIVQAYGSSPLARGLLNVAEIRHGSSRIIPARAGFTPCTCQQSGRSWDHPRSRGVYLRPNRARYFPAGSSPLARGLPLVCVCVVGVCGIIPARAGFT